MKRLRFLLPLLLLCQSACFGAIIQIDQNWRDTSGTWNGVIEGLSNGDTVDQVEDIGSPTWCVIIPNVDSILYRGNGYKLRPSDVDSIIIYNFSFETDSSSDSTLASGWSQTDSLHRMWGHHYMWGAWTDQPGVYHGNYAVRCGLPCTTQVLKSNEMPTFDTSNHWCVVAQVLNRVDGAGDVRFRIGLIDSEGDTAYAATCSEGISTRGSIPIWVDFYTGDTSEAYYVFVEITGASEAPTGNWVWIDQVMAMSYLHFGIAIKPEDNIGWSHYMTGVGTDWFQNLEYYDNTAGAENVKIENVDIEFATPSFRAVSIHQGAAALGTHIRDSKMFSDGVANYNVLFDYGPSSSVIACSLWMETRALFKREAMSNAQIYATAGRQSPVGAWGLVVDSSYLSGGDQFGITTTGRIESDGDQTVDYPLPEISNTTIQLKGRITNCAAIHSLYYAGLIADHNIIDCDTGDFGGKGIFFEGLSQTDWEPYIAYNTIRTKANNKNQEYKAFEWYVRTDAIQIEGINGCEIAYNDITAVAGDWKAGMTGGQERPSAICYRHNSGSQDVHFHHNTLRAQAHSKDVAMCLYWWNDEADQLEIHDNIFITNDAWIYASSGVDSMLFLDNEFRIDTTFVDSAYLKTSSATFAPNFQNINYAAVDLYFVGNIYPDDSTRSLFEDSYWHHWHDIRDYTVASYKATWRVGHEIPIQVRDAGEPAESAEVIILTVDSDTAAIDTTDATGDLLEYVYQFRDSAETTTYDRDRDRQEYNPYTFIAFSQDGAKSDTVEIEIDSSETITLTLGEASGEIIRRPSLLNNRQTGLLNRK